ncbi:hypothetical protein SAMN05444008_111131 [Cnuella takakiae]|uniref:Uncharacterized protein n=1 Tax=Cnuella takakiae TaxID=1302690 RepID=A0A1M5DYA4_9BACT|nr:hypothetical protein SAMN05444008_111131 [Cnuella takakiae]
MKTTDPNSNEEHPVAASVPRFAVYNRSYCTGMVNETCSFNNLTVLISVKLPD